MVEWRLLSMKYNKIILITIMLSLNLNSILAKKSDRDLPIKILTDNAEGNLDASNVQIFGNITIEQGTLLIHANKVNYKGIANKNQMINTSGNPATFQQVLDTKDQGGKNQVLKARANNIVYNGQTGNVTMQGDAHLNIGNNTISGNKIDYNTITEKYKVSSSKNKKASIVIYPKK
ncbi:MAG: lipopolysaccharide transport periplasmic protein LptA [Neisseriaceae bacterium]|nr:MAG: lipopolysaccharide transport periplasmic protein LptA [Neisseriaceae bacterium]